MDDMRTSGRGRDSDLAAKEKTLRALTAAVGAVFLLVGILGFIPGITTNYDTMTFAGHEGNAKLLGVFEVSVLHNIVHLLFGVVGLWAARAARTAVPYLIGGGVIYLLLWIYGLVIDYDDSANFIPVNDADNWLHLVLGVAMVLIGAVGARMIAPGRTGTADRTRNRR
ncbi:DUF4383 domain-containing protein [Mumia sp. Pv 4-285]|uniref:DUF4383 domain-containing protein n=1 Tax=Mumia qirimensis TaxID=3234852 RepID=UPI00351DA832